jgi:hypothetical protein
MNIFVLDTDIKKCAEYTCDKHVVKMILESAQMLSTACRVSGIDAGYKSTHKNRPCSIWVRNSLDNWKWLRSLVIELNREWKKRFKHTRNHKSYDVVMSLPTPPFKSIGLTPFAQVMPDKYKHKDAIKAYRDYYMGEKRKIAKWRNGKPYWYE